MTSTSFTWGLILIILFVVGLGFTIFDHVLVSNVNPAIENLQNNSLYFNDSQRTEMTADTEMYMKYWYAFPAIILLGLIIWGIATAIANKKIPGE